MSLELLLIIIAIVYIFDIFVLIWFSGRFAGIRSINFDQVVALGLAILLFSWLSFTAFFHAPLLIKPMILLIAAIMTIYIFITMLDTHFLKAIAAAIFFIFCQLVIFVYLIKQFWNKDFFQIIKIMIFR